MMIGGMQEIRGWYSGTSIDSEDTLAFSALRGVRSKNEMYPLDKVNEAYERMMSGKARFRVVLAIGQINPQRSRLLIWPIARIGEHGPKTNRLAGQDRPRASQGR